jgi:hypothetical protein
MRTSRIDLFVFWLALQFTVASYCLAQGTSLPADISPVAATDGESLQKYRVEVIAFAYHAFDTTEESFSEVPLGTLVDLLNPTLLNTHERSSPDQAAMLMAALLQVDPDLPSLIETEPVIPARRLLDLLPPAQEIDLFDEAAIAIGDPRVFLGPGADTDAGEDTALAPLETPPVLSTAMEVETSAVQDTIPIFEAGSTIETTAQFNLEADPDKALGAPTDVDSVMVPDEDAHWYRILLAEELELTDSYSRLDRLDVYTPVAHGGWVQEGLEEIDAIAFDLALLGAINPSGTVRLHVSRFLHVTVDVRFQAGREALVNEPPAQILSEIRLPPRFDLNIQRLTRSGELHYFDHPAFGVLVLVTPEVEEPVAEGDELAPAA